MRLRPILIVLLATAALGCGGAAESGGADVASREALAESHLRAIAAAQAQFQALAVRDADGDGAGEYGALAELAGRAPPGGAALKTPLLAGPFGGAAGEVEADGYRFSVWLPGTDGAVDADGAEREWVAVARPAAGGRAFVIDAAGEPAPFAPGKAGPGGAPRAGFVAVR